MTNTPQQAVKHALSLSKGHGGYCLRFVRLCYGINGVWPDAITAWNRSTRKVYETNVNNIPVGAPIFFSGSKYGHTAIYLGGGKMRTTTSKSLNKIRTDVVATWLSRGYQLLGYVEELNGKHITGLSATAPKPIVKHLSKGSKGAEVGKLQKFLRDVFPAYRNFVTHKKGQLISVDNDFGTQTEQWLKEFQRRVGLAQTGVVDDPTRAQLVKYGYKP